MFNDIRVEQKNGLENLHANGNVAEI